MLPNGHDVKINLGQQPLRRAWVINLKADGAALLRWVEWSPTPEDERLLKRETAAKSLTDWELQVQRKVWEALTAVATVTRSGDVLVEVVPILMVPFCQTCDDKPVDTGFRVLPHTTTPLTDFDLVKEELGAAGNEPHRIVTQAVLAERGGCLGNDWVRQVTERV